MQTTDNFDRIPDELQQLNRWVCWRIVQRDGKPTKVPVNPSTGGQAMSNNKSTWGTFQQAVAVARTGEIVDKRGEILDIRGIGFMLGNGFVGIDIDHCRDPQTGMLTEAAQDILHIVAGAYSEVSPSGTGVHIICRGSLPPGGRRKENVEMYSIGRYFTMTGEVIGNV